MNWGDPPAWLALALSGPAVWISLKARGDGTRSAAAAERSAVAAEETLAEQRREADERRRAEAQAAIPRVHLEVVHVSNDLFRLQNDGTAAATNITFEQDDLPAVFRLRDTGEVSLQPHEAVDFLMAGTMGLPMPPQLFARWDGQAEPVPVRVPPKR